MFDSSVITSSGC